LGEATDAYGGRLERYQRHVLFVKGEPPILVLYDDLAAREPATFQFMLHALAEFSVDPDQQRLSVTQPRAGVTVRYLSPTPLAFRQWDGYEPPPDREFPNQWHVEASTQTKEREVGMLTVLLPHRPGRQVEWSLERVESETAIGVRAKEPKRALLIGFRKPGVVGRASLAEAEFDTVTVVRPLP
jgi:hypothetical protein